MFRRTQAELTAQERTDLWNRIANELFMHLTHDGRDIDVYRTDHKGNRRATGKTYRKYPGTSCKRHWKKLVSRFTKENKAKMDHQSKKSGVSPWKSGWK